MHLMAEIRNFVKKYGKLLFKFGTVFDGQIVEIC